MKSRQFEHGGNVYDAPPTHTAWIDFSANINPLGLSAQAEQAIRQHIPELIQYPDPQGRKIKEALSSYYGVPGEQLVLGNGAAELFYLYMHQARPRQVVIPVPSFSEYERSAAAVQAHITPVYLQEDQQFALPWKQLLSYCGKADCIILGNPNNPTGTTVSVDAVQELVEAAQGRGTDILIDESFLDFLPHEHLYSARTLIQQYDCIMSIRSLTKFYALPGLRLGFAAVSPQKAAALEAHKDVWNVNLLAQYAGIAALADRAYQERTRQYVETEKTYLYESLRRIPGIHVYAPSVNFILFRILRSGWTAQKLAAALRNEGILIRNCDNYMGLDESYVRIAVKRREDNEVLIQKMKALLV